MMVRAVIVLVLTGGSLVAQAEELTAAALGPFIDAAIAREMDEHHIPGAVFVLARRDGVVYGRGYGLADVVRGTPMDAERTVIRVGSVSKTFTALAALQLVAADRVGLHEDVNQVLRDFRIPDTWPQPVTLFHCLTHTAGFGESYLGQHAATPEAWRPIGPWLADHLPRRCFPPGAVVAYNDAGTCVAAHAVESVSGQPLARHLEEKVFQPLGMDSTTFEQVSLPRDLAARRAKSYRWTAGRHRAYDFDFINTAPAAGLYTTGADMGRFMTALLAGGRSGDGRILEERWVRAMTSRQVGGHPRLPGRGFGFVEDRENGRLIFRKDGQCTGFTARLTVLPEDGVAFFSAQTLSILEPGGSRNGAARFTRIVQSELLDRWFPAAPDPPDPLPPPTAESVGWAALLAGTYRDVTDPRDTVESAFLCNEIEIVDRGDGTVAVDGDAPWVAVEPRLIQYADGGPHYAAFAADDDGRIRFLLIGTGAFERVGSLGTRAARIWSLVAAFGLLFGALSFLGGRAVLHRWRGRARPAAPHPRGLAALTVTAALLHVGGLAILGITLLTGDPQLLVFRAAPTTFRIALALPLLAVALTIWLGGLYGRAWRQQRLDRPARVGYGIALLALTAIPVALHASHLLGFRFGAG